MDIHGSTLPRRLGSSGDDQHDSTAIVWLWDNCRRSVSVRHDEHMSSDDLVTVLIPARNEELFLPGCLDSVRSQDYAALQILVVDGNSSDRTPDIVKACMAEDERIELLHNPIANIPSSLNMAVAQARGRWVVRIDAHSTIGPSYVRLAIQRLREGSWGGVGGRKDGIGRTSAGRAIAVAMASRFGVGNSTYHFGTTIQEVDHLPFGAYPLEVVHQMGGWNERLTANEDFEFDYRLRRAGMPLLFDPGLVIAWHCRQSIGDLFWQYHRYGRGKVDVARLHPDSLRLRHLAPPAFVGYAAVGAALNARHPVRWLAMLAPYAAAVAFESMRAGRRLESLSDKLNLPSAFVAMHVGWGMGFWSGVRTTLFDGGRVSRVTTRPQPRAGQG